MSWLLLGQFANSPWLVASTNPHKRPGRLQRHALPTTTTETDAASLVDRLCYGISSTRQLRHRKQHSRRVLQDSSKNPIQLSLSFREPLFLIIPLWLFRPKQSIMNSPKYSSIRTCSTRKPECSSSRSSSWTKTRSTLWTSWVCSRIKVSY